MVKLNQKNFEINFNELLEEYFELQDDINEIYFRRNVHFEEDEDGYKEHLEAMNADWENTIDSMIQNCLNMVVILDRIKKWEIIWRT